MPSQCDGLSPGKELSKPSNNGPREKTLSLTSKLRENIINYKTIYLLDEKHNLYFTTRINVNLSYNTKKRD
jgi:hypothetical protein